EQAAPAAVLAPTLFLGQQTGSEQVCDGPFHRPAGEVQFLGDGSDGRITLPLLVAAVFQVHIHRLGPVRQILGINGCKISDVEHLLIRAQRGTARAAMLLLLRCRGVEMPAGSASSFRRQRRFVHFILVKIIPAPQDLLLQLKAIRVDHRPCGLLCHLIGIAETNAPLEEQRELRLHGAAAGLGQNEMSLGQRLEFVR
ncbi:DUF6329 domain-containing protein, partial [Dysosmobacter welbionis]